MTVASDVSARLSDDAQYANSEFYTTVFEYGAGIIEILADWGYQAGTAVKLELEVSRDNAEVYTEGQALPTPLEGTTISPSFTPKHFRAVIRESGHERRARGDQDQGVRIANPQLKTQRAIRAIKDLMAQTFDDAATYGLQGIISKTGYNFGDQNRSTYSTLQSYELNALGAAISTALLNNFAHRSADTPYGCAFDLVITSATQASKWAELGSGKLQLGAASGALNMVFTELSLGTAPVAILPNLTNSVILGLTGVRDGMWGVVWNEPNPGRFHVLDLGAANADNPLNLQISTALSMACLNPQQQGKLYGLSTT